MTRILTIGLLLLISISGYCYEWRHVAGKKVFKDLNEALKTKEKVYNLQLYSQVIDLNKLKEIGKLDSLQFLELEKCYLKDLPDEIFKLPNLRTLILNYNEFTTIPTGIKYCKKLEYFTMHHCICLLYTSPSPRDRQKSRMPSSA